MSYFKKLINEVVYILAWSVFVGIFFFGILSLFKVI
jgi:hypothetical protein